MTKQTPLHTLIELTQSRLDDATRELGHLLASEREDAQKLELLVNYRTEYQARFMSAAQDGMGLEAWRNYQSFLGRLDEAVDHQTRVVAEARERSAAGQQAWMAHRTKAKAYDKLSQRIDAREAVKEARQEQKAGDEHAVKNFLSHRDEDSDN